MRNRYDQQLGNVDDAMPDGGAPRLDMGFLDSNVNYGLVASPRGWRFARAEWSDWTILDQGNWNFLVENISNIGIYNSDPTGTANFSNFIEAGGDFEVLLGIIGTKPMMPTYPRPTLRFPYPHGSVINPRPISAGASWGFGYGVWNEDKTDYTTKVSQAMNTMLVAVPYVEDVIHF